MGDRIARDRILLNWPARVIISDNRGSLADQINGRSPVESPCPSSPRPGRHRSDPRCRAMTWRSTTGWGGFTADGREDVMTTADGQLTPSPRAVNPHFGGRHLGERPRLHLEQITESRLTPWETTASDSSGEAFYLRDEERGHFWSPTAPPCRGTTPYATRHGFGYSVFEHIQRGIRSELTVYVALDAATASRF